MSEFLLILFLVLMALASSFLIKQKLAKVFILIFTLTCFLGNAMNLLVMRLNDNRMPVMSANTNWDDAPSIDLPDFLTKKVAGQALPKLRSWISPTRESHPHTFIEAEMESTVTLAFLADKYPLKMSEKRIHYSLGDVFIVVSMIWLLVGLIPVAVICAIKRRRQKADA